VGLFRQIKQQWNSISLLSFVEFNLIASLKEKMRPRCFLDVEIDNKSIGRIIVELFSEELPKTCENFRCLCTGEKGLSGSKKPLHYKNSPFHRVIKGFMIQGGDFTNKDGTGGESIYGEKFDDEGFIFKHSEPGLLSMANAGKNTNGSQFFITTVPCPHLDGVHVVFGRVVDGMETVHAIENLLVDKNFKPFANVVISNCGELVLKAIPKALLQSQIPSDSESSESDNDRKSKKRKKHKKAKKEKKHKKSKKHKKDDSDTETQASPVNDNQQEAEKAETRPPQIVPRRRSTPPPPVYRDGKKFKGRGFSHFSRVKDRSESEAHGRSYHRHYRDRSPRDIRERSPRDRRDRSPRDRRDRSSRDRSPQERRSDGAPNNSQSSSNNYERSTGGSSRDDKSPHSRSPSPK